MNPLPEPLPNMRSRIRSMCDEPERSYRRQVAEDTCEEHGEFCCPLCFNMTTTESEDQPQ